MTDSLLKARIRPVVRRHRRVRLFLALAAWWLVAALVAGAALWLQKVAAVGSARTLPILVVLGAVGSVVVLVRHSRTRPDVRAVAREIERRYPDLHGLLLTVVQQEADEAGRFSFLQQRVLRDAVEHSVRNRWSRAVPWWKPAGSHVVHLAAFAVFVALLGPLRVPPGPKAPSRLKVVFTGIEVTPGDVSIERGDSLVVLVRFGTAPKEAELVVEGGPGKPSRIPLTRSLADPVFGGSVPDVSSDFTYRVAYGTTGTRAYKVAVFEHPKLERADADLAFPAYTGLPSRHIEDTRRISAVEGSTVDLALQLNKPVASATLVPRGTNSLPLALSVGTNRPTASLAGHLPVGSTTYDLRLVDADGRSNKVAAQFVFEAQPNRPPELKLASPRGDQRPSALEEMTFGGTVWDDFGVQRFGLAFTQVGQETQFVELGREVPAKEKREFHHLLRLEDLGAKPDQVVAWFAWADDIGPDGKTRRTTGDLFFAEVRPFEQIFREGEGQSGGEQEQGGEQGQGNPTTKLAELQKQIINATWRLQRDQRAKTGKGGDPGRPADGAGPEKKGTSSLRGVEPALKAHPSIAWGGASLARGTPGERMQPSLRPEGPAPGRPRLASDGQPGPRFAQPRRYSAALAAPRQGLLTDMGPSIDDNRAVVDKGALTLTELLRVSPQSQFMGQREPADSVPASSPRPPRRANTSSQPVKKAAAPVRYEDDLAVVRGSAVDAIEQAKATMERQQSPGAKTLWSAAISQMERSLEELDKAKGSPAALSDALVAEQAAYQALLKLQARETSVTRSRKPGQGQQQGEQPNQRQLDELELTQSEDRYETQRQARAPQDESRREQLQVQDRLKELARRQEDVNERLKELQTSMQEAKTEKEREEVRRQLKRLQEEQKKQLAEVDELQQRMDRPENQSGMAEQRKQLEQTRDELQRAAEATGDGKVQQALASGTRAQRQLQEMRDALRKQNSSEFAEEMREMREQARELARKEEDIAKKLEALDTPDRKTLGGSEERQKAIDQLDQQRARMTNLLARATQVSQQAESSEPLVSRQLYDTLRKASQADAESAKKLQEDLIRSRTMTRSLYDRLQDKSSQDGSKAIELTAEMLRQGYDAPARSAEARARASIESLRQGVERAAEKVLGDDTEALRLAQQELDTLTRQLDREMAQAGDGTQRPGTNSVAQANGGTQAGRSGNEGQGPAKDGEAKDPTATTQNPGGTPGEQGRQPGPGSAQGQGPGRPQPSREAGQQEGQQPGQQAVQQGGRQPGAGQPGGGRQPGSPQQGGRPDTADRGGKGGGGADVAGPITGGDFAPWADRLRDVEDMVDQPDLRSSLATAREQARLMRLEYRRDLKKPDWANVQLKIVKPLVEVRNRIREELARRTPEETLVPIDRDPVPTRYSELVRRYYEDLGKDK